MIKVARGCVGEDELAAVREAFAYGYFGLAGKVTEFERALGERLGAGDVIATNTGTSALHLALDAIGIGPGDEVIVPSLTFVGSFQAVSATGATPVACEVLPDTLLIDPKDVRRRITSRTRAIMPVHYGGASCDMVALSELAFRHRLRIVEDAAHALGSTWRGRTVGSDGDLVCFSFDSIKNITCGEGGAIVCHDPPLAEVLRRKLLLGIDRRAHASTNWKERSWRYSVGTQGFRYHLSNINAAIGLVQLGKLGGFIARRRALCRRYDAVFAGVSGVCPLAVDYDEVAPHIYVVRIADGRRDALVEHLRGREIETGINYIPNHLHPYFAREGLRLPVTERLFEEILTLPLHCELSDDDVDTVAGHVKEFMGHA
jgi:perosamine synthetase